MPRSRLKVVPKSVPAAMKKTSPPKKTMASERSSPSIPRESDFSTGDTGVVKQIDGDKLTIDFTGKNHEANRRLLCQTPRTIAI